MMLNPINRHFLLQKMKKTFSPFKGSIVEKASLKKITWFRSGGAAKILYEPANLIELQVFLKNLPLEIPIKLIGMGSNTLVRDGGIDAVVIRLLPKLFGKIELLSATQLKVGAGAACKWLSAAALKYEISGFHFYHGIPGSIGGALRMNAGANRTETKDVLQKVCVLNRQGDVSWLDCNEIGYSYRHCGLDPTFIFISAVFQGEKGKFQQIQDDIKAVQTHRELIQPIREKTGGSTFKNPSGFSAWRLIEDAGCRGFMIGQAEMSEKHCNFMINKDRASSYDLEFLGETVRSKVFKNSGIRLEWEIDRVGLFEKNKQIFPFLEDF